MKSYTWRAGIIKSSLPSTTRHVLLTLSCHINDAGESAYPSVELLAEETGLSKKSIITHLAEAKAAGWLIVKKHGFSGQRWARNEYYPSFPEPSEVKKGGEGDTPPKEKGGEGDSKGGEPEVKKVVKEVHPNYSYELPIEHTKTPPTPPRHEATPIRTMPALFFALTNRQPNAYQRDELVRIKKNYPQEAIEHAFSEAGKAGADLRYVAAVLEGRGKKQQEPEYDNSDDHLYLARLKELGVTGA